VELIVRPVCLVVEFMFSWNRLNWDLFNLQDKLTITSTVHFKLVPLARTRFLTPPLNLNPHPRFRFLLLFLEISSDDTMSNFEHFQQSDFRRIELVGFTRFVRIEPRGV